MSALEIFNPLFTLFEYVYNFFAVFGEVATTETLDIYLSLTNFTQPLEYTIANPFNSNLFTFTLDFTIFGNGVISSIISILDNLSSNLFNVSILGLPFYATAIISCIPFALLFWFIGIIKKLLN